MADEGINKKEANKTLIISLVVIGIFIIQAFFNLSDNVRWIIIGILSVLWLIYYYF